MTSGIVPATDPFRLALLQAFTNCPPEARAELAAELAHQRDNDRFFRRTEGWTLVVVAFLIGFVAAVGVAMIVAGAPAAGILTLLGDVVGAGEIALRRSYFIDRQQQSGQGEIEAPQ